MSLGLVSLVGLVVLALIGWGVARMIMSLVGALFRGRGKEGAGVQAGHVTLNCPHCQQPTRADRHICEHCNRDL